MNSLVSTENGAGICRITCGWKKPELPLDKVRRYWRDVHSPAIARRAGIYDYRHFQFDPVLDDLFAPVDGIDYACPAGEQLMWLSDVRYADDAALETFGRSPEGEVKAQMLGDIDLIVDQSTTYKAVGKLAETYKDETGTATPQGTPKLPTFGLFFRQRGEEAPFRAALAAAAKRWADDPNVLRLRLSLLEAPDMEAERAAGYPIKTHPVERQYQAWIDLVLRDAGAARGLVAAAGNLGEQVRQIHAYPVTTLCTFNYAGRPTIVGLRGYPAYEALTGLGGWHQGRPEILEWMYGPVARGVGLTDAGR